MIFSSSKYSSLIGFLAVLGLFVSMVHYHSEGLECLDHAEEAHFIQTQDYCPVSTLVTDEDFITTFTFEVLLPYQDLLISAFSEEIIDLSISIKKGRSPPTIA